MKRIKTKKVQYKLNNWSDECMLTLPRAVIPPRKRAKIWQRKTRQSRPLDRDENLRYIRKHGSKKWKKDFEYHVRSIAETAMSRLKRIFGDRLNSRLYRSQGTDLFIRCSALNKMLQVGRPESYAVKA